MVERTGFEPPAIRLPERSSDSAGSHGTVENGGEGWIRTTSNPLAGLRSNDSAGSHGTVENGGEGWIRTSVRLRGQIYSLLPLTTRPPLHEMKAGAPCGGAPMLCQRGERAPLTKAQAAPSLRCGCFKIQSSPDGQILERVKGIEPSS